MKADTPIHSQSFFPHTIHVLFALIANIRCGLFEITNTGMYSPTFPMLTGFHLRYIFLSGFYYWLHALDPAARLPMHN